MVERRESGRVLGGKVVAPCGAADAEEAQACVGDVGGEEVGEGCFAALGGDKVAEGVEGGEGELRGL